MDLERLWISWHRLYYQSFFYNHRRIGGGGGSSGNTPGCRSSSPELEPPLGAVFFPIYLLVVRS